MRNTKSKIFLNFFLLLFAIVFSALLIEILLRIFYPQNLNITTLDSERVFKHKEGIDSVLRRNEFSTNVKISSQGLRDREYSVEKIQGTKRVAVVGDSFVFGFGVEQNETFAKLLEEKLNKVHGNYEVMNFGTSAYSSEQEYLYMKNEIIKFNPDLTILAFSLNDIKENVKFNIFDFKNNTLMQNPEQKITFSLKLRNFISWNSHLYSLMYFSVIENEKLRILLIQLHLLNPPYKNPDTDFDSLIYQNNNNPDFKYSVNKTIALLAAMNNLAKKNNITFTIFINPTKEQVDNKKNEEYIHDRNLDKARLNMTQVQQILKENIGNKGIMTIDPLDIFRKQNINNTFYYDIDGHWNKKGHNLVADILYGKLATYKLI